MLLDACWEHPRSASKTPSSNEGVLLREGRRRHDDLLDCRHTRDKHVGMTNLDVPFVSAPDPNQSIR